MTHGGAVPNEWDVVVIGAGPAGAAAAHAAALGEARVLLLERASMPRYKTCGGGLIGTSVASLPDHLRPPVQARVSRATFTLGGAWAFTRSSRRPFLDMVYRDQFDAALAAAAQRAGTEVRTGVTVRGLVSHDDGVVVEADGGSLTAAVVLGADGSASRVARHVGVRCSQVDLALEVEIPRSSAQMVGWSDRLLLDWGPVPGAYGWVFPKGDGLTVGVIADRDHGDAVRSYLEDFLHQLRLHSAFRRMQTGHLTRCRTEESPLRRGRVLVVGDAAGLLEPWTREGISFALRSGRLAGEAAARAVGQGSPSALEGALAEYERAVRATLAPEMRAGATLADAFHARPRVIHAGLATPLGWRSFRGFCRGEATLATLAARPSVRAPLRLLTVGRSPARRRGAPRSGG